MVFGGWSWDRPRGCQCRQISFHGSSYGGGSIQRPILGHGRGDKKDHYRQVALSHVMKCEVAVNAKRKAASGNAAFPYHELAFPNNVGRERMSNPCLVCCMGVSRVFR